MMMSREGAARREQCQPLDFWAARCRADEQRSRDNTPTGLTSRMIEPQ